MEDVVESTNAIMVFQNRSLPVKYANDERWCDVHPIAEQLLQRALESQGSGDGNV